MSGSRVTQLETALYADQPFGQAVGGEVLMSVSRCQIAEMMIDA